LESIVEQRCESVLTIYSGFTNHALKRRGAAIGRDELLLIRESKSDPFEEGPDEQELVPTAYLLGALLLT
jgi:hypothetical protein